MTVTKVEAIALAAPFADIYGSADDVPRWLLHPAASHQVSPRLGQYATVVRVHNDDGTVGVGEAYGLPAPEVTALIVDRLLAPALLGRDPVAGTAIWRDLHAGQAAAGHLGGFYLEALSGVDLALWDLRGKLLGQPVHRLLGGPTRDRVPVYASPVPLLPEPEESAAAAAVFVKQGFTAVKVKIGRGVATDLEHLTAVRDATGPDVTLLTDANCAYSLDEATRLAQRLPEVGVRWLEEPLAVDDLAGLAELRRRCGLTIVNGETHFSATDVRQSLLHQAIDVVMPNLTRCGGITEGLRIAALAGAFHVAVSPHGVGSGIGLCAALQFMAAIPNGRIYEYNQLLNPLRERLLRQPPVFRDGHLHLPQTPGLGFELDEETVARYTVR